MRPTRAARSAALVAAITAGMLVCGLLVTRDTGPFGGRPGQAVQRSTPASAVTVPVSTAGLDATVTGLQQRLRRLPGDYQSWAVLGTAYVQLASVTGDPTYYPRAAAAARRSLRLRPSRNDAALTGLAALAAARHRFAQAREHARAALRVNPYSAAAYGVLSDALTQLGRYPQAFAALQHMLDLRPGVPSFTRASYAWELQGRTGLATSALRRALDVAARPSDAAFCLYHLGELAWQDGDLAAARRRFARGLTRDGSYAPLLAGLAKVDAAGGRIASALHRYDQLVQRSPLPEHLVAYGDLLAATGRVRAARRQYALVDATVALFRDEGVRPDPSHVLFVADHGSPGEALALARSLWRDQRSIDAADAYAWALHVNGRNQEARRLARKAGALGTRSALLAYHRGIVERALGDRMAARRHLARALRLNPHFSPLHAPRARAALDALEPR